MKRAVAVILMVLGVALMLTACHSSTSHVKLTPSQSAEARKIGRQAEQVITVCTEQSGSLHKIISCIAPPNHKAAFEQCSLRLAPDVTNHARLEQGLDYCLVRAAG